MTPTALLERIPASRAVRGRGRGSIQWKSAGSKRHAVARALPALRRSRVVARRTEPVGRLVGRGASPPRRASCLPAPRCTACAPCSGRRRDRRLRTADTAAGGCGRGRLLRFEELLGEARVASARRRRPPAGAECDCAGRSTCGAVPPLHGLTDTTPVPVPMARRLEALRIDAPRGSGLRPTPALGEHREIVSALRTAVEENPFRERLQGAIDAGALPSRRPPG